MIFVCCWEVTELEAVPPATFSRSSSDNSFDSASLVASFVSSARSSVAHSCFFPSFVSITRISSWFARPIVASLVFSSTLLAGSIQDAQSRSALKTDSKPSIVNSSQPSSSAHFRNKFCGAFLLSRSFHLFRAPFSTPRTSRARGLPGLISPRA